MCVVSFIELTQQSRALGDPVVWVLVGRELDWDNKVGGVTWRAGEGTLTALLILCANYLQYTNTNTPTPPPPTHIHTHTSSYYICTSQGVEHHTSNNGHMHIMYCM